MQRIECSQRMSGETNQEVACIDGVAVFQWMNFKEAVSDVFLECRDDPTFSARVDLSIPAAAAKQAMELDDDQAANRYGRHALQEAIEFIRTDLEQIALRHCAGVDINPVT